MNKDFLGQRYNHDEFVSFISGFLPDFEYNYAVVEPEHEIFQSISVLGRALRGSLYIFEIKTNKIKGNERVSITKEAFRIMMKRGISQALVCFYAGGQSWRMSLLTMSAEYENGKIKKKGSNPRRHSYYLGEKAKIHTPYEFLIKKGPVSDFDDLKSRFSVEVVNKEFYSGVSQLFFDLVGGHDGKTKHEACMMIQGLKKGDQIAREFAVRLLGRIIFCWFLKEKRSKQHNAPLIPDELLSIEMINSSTNYYHDILEPLFFETLNRKQSNRRGIAQANPLFQNIPYLNGGLFNAQEGDYYKYDQVSGIGTYGVLSIPNEWFSRLLSILNTFNFTVDENTSFDTDLSIDPEMLGRIFENLLAEINPTTEESAKKSTGSFYTPREIVDYMVDQSLIAYLSSKTKLEPAKLSALISYNALDDEDFEIGDDVKDAILGALSNITILDPACGSGAFPIGLLQKIVYILQIIDPDAQLWLKHQLEGASPEFTRDIKEKYNKGSYDYLRKLGVIRESVFGVDIQPLAVEIARLRCFLTLIVDEDVYDDKPNRDIRPLPNLDFKFVAADSLTGLPMNQPQGSLLENEEHIEALKEVREEYFTASSSEKPEIREHFHEIQRQMFQTALDLYKSREYITERYNMLMDWEPFSSKSSSWFDPEWMFGRADFDIVIGNPPYIQLQNDGGRLGNKYKDRGYLTFTKTGDIYSLFYERGINLLRAGGHLCFITSNKWLRAGYGEKTRGFLARYNPIQLIDFSGIKVFESATVDTNILLIEKASNQKATQCCTTKSKECRDNLSEYIKQNSSVCHFTSSDSWVILTPIEQSIKDKIERIGTPLKDWDIKINYGIKTGCNKAFIISTSKRNQILASCKDEDERKRTEELIRPILRGRDIKRGGYEWAGLYIINVHNGYKTDDDIIVPPIDINEYPALKDWFDNGDWNNKPKKGTNYERLSIRTDKGVTPYNLRDCAYMDDFSKQKICYSETNSSRATKIALDDRGHLTDKTCFVITSSGDCDIESLYKILSSEVFIWYMNLLSPKLGDGGISLTKDTVRLFPACKKIKNSIEETYLFTDEEINLISASVNSNSL